MQVMCTTAVILTAHTRHQSAVSWLVTLELCIYRFVHMSVRNAAGRLSSDPISFVTRECTFQRSHSGAPCAAIQALGVTSSKNIVPGIMLRRLAMTSKNWRRRHGSRVVQRNWQSRPTVHQTVAEISQWMKRLL